MQFPKLAPPEAKHTNAVHRIAASRGIKIPATKGSLTRQSDHTWLACNQTRNGVPVPDELYTFKGGKWSYAVRS